MQNKLEEQLINQAEIDNIDRYVVGVVILRQSDKILILQRNNNDFMGGIDELPSGKVESNESLIITLIRELKEETGLNVKKVLDYIGYFDYLSKSGKKTRQFNFLVTDDDGNVVVNPSEHSGYYWVDLKNLSTTKLTNNVIQMINYYFKGKKTA